MSQVDSVDLLFNFIVIIIIIINHCMYWTQGDESMHLMPKNLSMKN